MVLHSPLHLQVVCARQSIKTRTTAVHGEILPYSYHDGPLSALTFAYTRETEDMLARGIDVNLHLESPPDLYVAHSARSPDVQLK